MIWSGSLTMGLVNIPVRAVPLTRDMGLHLRMLHRSCRTRISLRRFCQEGREVPLSEIVFGYPLGKDRYVVLERGEVDGARPASKDVISIDRFVSFFQADPHYFERTYLLLPDRSEEAYSLLRTVMERTGKAAIGRITLRDRERAVLVHYYRDAIVATTLRYWDEIADPKIFASMADLPKPDEKEIELAEEIVERLTGDLDLAAYRDEYRERIEGLVRSKLGEAVPTVKEERGRPAAKGLMEALRMTAESLR